MMASYVVVAHIRRTQQGQQEREDTSGERVKHSMISSITPIDEIAVASRRLEGLRLGYEAMAVWGMGHGAWGMGDRGWGIGGKANVKLGWHHGLWQVAGGRLTLDFVYDTSIVVPSY